VTDWLKPGVGAVVPLIATTPSGRI